MKKNIYNLVSIFLGISLSGYSQQFTGKIYPTDPSLTYQFGYAQYEGICLDEKTLIVSDYRGRKTINSACQYDQGNVNIYKKNGNNAWEISQVLTSDSNIHFFWC